MGLLLIALTAAATAVSGCAGPPRLSRAILPRDREEYSRALAADPANPKHAFLGWRARQRGISLADAVQHDAAVSPTTNPFDANRDRNAVSLGAMVFAAHCQRCHGENVDGRGPDVSPEAPCHDFHAFDKRFAVTLHRGAPKAWFAKIRDGHGPTIEYPSGPSSAMPPFGQTLSNEQIWLVITYLQSLDMYVPEPTPAGA
ncbi:MAG: cytochrome c [Planctomycetes bacterium]|nr:cytochrome c [Planctomycetota bacterium]